MKDFIIHKFEGEDTVFWGGEAKDVRIFWGSFIITVSVSQRFGGNTKKKQNLKASSR